MARDKKNPKQASLMNFDASQAKARIREKKPKKASKDLRHLRGSSNSPMTLLIPVGHLFPHPGFPLISKTWLLLAHPGSRPGSSWLLQDPALESPWTSIKLAQEEPCLHL